MLIVPGPSSRELGLEVAELLGAEVVPVELKLFPDGESYVRLRGDLRGEHVAIVQTMSPPQDTRFLQALLLVEAAKASDASKVTLVAPYLAYARQDRRFFGGEALSLAAVAKSLLSVGTDELITVNVHNPEALRAYVPLRDVSAIGLLAKYFDEQGFRGTVAVSLGKRGERIAAEADRVLRGGCISLTTRRDPKTGQVRLEGDVELRGDAIIFDDIISTGGTVIEAIRFLREKGADRVFVACVHPLLVAGALQRILGSGAERVVGTNTVPSPVSFVSVAPLIADALRA